MAPIEGIVADNYKKTQEQGLGFFIKKKCRLQAFGP